SLSHSVCAIKGHCSILVWSRAPCVRTKSSVTVLSNSGHGGKAWWKFEKMPPNRGGMAGWDGGHGGIADIFLVFCAVGVRLTRPNLTRN
ncbi:hypothetical protein glysoja_041762, partial [Glycine soja]